MGGTDSQPGDTDRRNDVSSLGRRLRPSRGVADANQSGIFGSSESGIGVARGQCGDVRLGGCRPRRHACPSWGSPTKRSARRAGGPRFVCWSRFRSLVSAKAFH